MPRIGPYVYTENVPGEGPGWRLRFQSGAEDERALCFRDRLEIGRYQAGADPPPGILLIDDRTVSRRHCLLACARHGSCTLRDTSRNGTWLDGRRLVPNIEVSIRSGQVLSLGNGHQFVLEGTCDPEPADVPTLVEMGTLSLSATNVATVLVGDIRDYTLLVQRVGSDELQRSVGRVFQELEKGVTELGGVVKEYPGDAIFAFWEQRPGGNCALEACRAALSLDRLGRRLAVDTAIWAIEEYPLRIDWALATGPVAIRSMGGDRPTGLSMVGEPVVLAFRVEKLATDETGSILACERTVEMAGAAFATRDLGPIEAKGFETSKRIFSILGARVLDES